MTLEQVHNAFKIEKESPTNLLQTVYKADSIRTT